MRINQRISKIIISLVPLLLLSLSFSAQTHEIDSLKQVLQKEKTDTGRILLLTDLSFRLFESKPDTAMVMAIQALEISQNIGYKKGEARSYRRIGNIILLLGNFAKSLELQLNALRISEEINDLEGIAGATGNIGLVYMEQEDYHQSLSYFFKAVALHRIINNKIGEVISLSNISENYRRQKKYDSASLYAQQSYNLAVQINYKRIIGASTETLGKINFDLENYSLAIEYLRFSFPYLIQSGNFNVLSESYLIMAKLFERQSQHDSVIHYGTLARAIAEKRGFILELRDAARFLSHYYRKHNADSAFFYQDISKACNDSLFNQHKQQVIYNLAFEEKLRQQELQVAAAKAKDEQKQNLQYSAIALGLVAFVILFFLFSHSIIANQKLIKFLGIFALLILFEFIGLFVHPYLNKWTNHSIPIMLGVMVCIAALLIPMHHKLEHWITHRLVEKNKRIRLAAAKKTIAELENEIGSVDTAKSTNAQH